MAKLKKNFLQQVIKEVYVTTRKYEYKATNITEPEYQYCLIKRIPKEMIGTASMLNKDNWEIVATTFDGENFIHI